MNKQLLNTNKALTRISAEFIMLPEDMRRPGGQEAAEYGKAF